MTLSHDGDGGGREASQSVPAQHQAEGRTQHGGTERHQTGSVAVWEWRGEPVRDCSRVRGVKEEWRRTPPPPQPPPPPPAARPSGGGPSKRPALNYKSALPLFQYIHGCIMHTIALQNAWDTGGALESMMDGLHTRCVVLFAPDNYRRAAKRWAENHISHSELQTDDDKIAQKKEKNT